MIVQDSSRIGSSIVHKYEIRLEMTFYTKILIF